jgi:hypothetical protein
MQYDAEAAPDPSLWLEAAEDARVAAIRRYHQQRGEPSGNLRVHAAIHATVETQLAEALPATVRAMTRLLGQGLTRHQALHAIGSAVADQLYSALHGQPFSPADYEARLDALTAASWRSSADE